MDTQKYIRLVGAESPLTCAVTQSTPSLVRQHRTENGNLGKFGLTFRHGAGFAPKQCLYQKEARAMESPKLYSLRRCKKPTYLCGYAKHPVSCKVAQGRERKFGEIWAYFSPWCNVSTEAILYQKEASAMESSKMCSLTWCKKPTSLCRYTKYPISCKAAQGRERKFGEIRAYLSPWCSVCTKAMFISKKVRVMENPKMYSLSRYKKPTYLCGYAKYPVSCQAAHTRERKVGEIRGSLSPCCSVSTKAMFISKGS